MTTFLKKSAMWLVACLLAAVIGVMGWSGTALAAPSPYPVTGPLQRPEPTPAPPAGPDGTIDIGPTIRNTDLPLAVEGYQVRPSGIDQQAPVTYTVGMTRTFVALDNERGRYFLTTYEVRLISDTVEVWVQQDLRYRNPDQSVNPIHPDTLDPLYITQERITGLAQRFENIILPTDVAFFGDYTSRDGAGATLPGSVGLPADYYAGPGKRVIILVSNVRDANYYDPAENPSFIAGFFSPTVNAFAGRNIITIDSKQWNRRVGPPNYDFDSTIAHEFQHLINGDYDENEDTWANEAASEYAEFINGFRPTAESHRTQFSDYPENSLTVWGDQNDDPDQPFEILADYQQAYWFYLYLAGRIQEAGLDLENDQFLKDVSALTQSEENSVDAINTMLASIGASFRFRDLWEDFRTAMLYGGTSDGTAWGDYITAYQPPSGIPIAPLDLGRLRRNLTFEGYDTPGAPPYGSDYIEVGWSPSVQSSQPITFDGDNILPTLWRTVPVSATGVAPSGTVTDNVLYSGHIDLTDNFLIFPVTVPATGTQTLSFDTVYNIELGWDFGFVQVTTDITNATGFTSLALTGTITETDPDAFPLIQSNVPGFSGVSGGGETPTWVNVTYDMSAYAGQDLLLAFRYATDPATAGQVPPPPAPGWYLDNIQLGNSVLFTETLPADAESIWEARGIENNFLVDLVTFANQNGAEIADITSVTLDALGMGTFNLGSLLSQPGFNEAGERVVALVSAVAPQPEADLISGPSGYVGYTLTGLPPSLYTSRARALGTAADSSVSSARVYPDDIITMTVALDNLGRNANLDAAIAQGAAAIPLPAHTTLVDGSLDASAEAANLRSTDNLSTIDAALPAVPGVYWDGTVTDTVDLEFALRVSAVITPNVVITPVVQIANAPFSAGPSQQFDGATNVIRVVSPLALSTATRPEMVMLGEETTFTYTLVNTDDAVRVVDFQLDIPDGVQITRLNITPAAPTPPTAAQAGPVTLRLSVPSYLQTGQVLAVAVTVAVDTGYVSDTLDLKAVALIPDSGVAYVVPTPRSVSGRSGPVAVAGVRIWLPLINR